MAKNMVRLRTSRSNPYAPCIVYLPTKLGHLWGTVNVSQYASTMEDIGRDPEIPIEVLPKNNITTDNHNF